MDIVKRDLMGNTPLNRVFKVAAPSEKTALGSSNQSGSKPEWWEGTTAGRALLYSNHLNSFKKWLGVGTTKPSPGDVDIVSQIMDIKIPGAVTTSDVDLQLPPPVQRVLNKESSSKPKIKPKPLGQPLKNDLNDISPSKGVGADLNVTNRGSAPDGSGGTGASLFNPLTGSNIMAKRSSFFDFFQEKQSEAVNLPLASSKGSSEDTSLSDPAVDNIIAALDTEHSDTPGSLHAASVEFGSGSGREGTASYKEAGFNPLKGVMGFFREGAEATKRVKRLQKQLGEYPMELVNARKVVDSSEEALNAQQQVISRQRNLAGDARAAVRQQQTQVSDIQGQLSDIRRLQDIRKDQAQHHILGLRKQLDHIDPGAPQAAAWRQEIGLAKQTMQPMEKELERSIELRRALGPQQTTLNQLRSQQSSVENVLSKQQKKLTGLQEQYSDAKGTISALNQAKDQATLEIAKQIPTVAKYKNVQRGIGAGSLTAAGAGLAYWSKNSSYSNPFERMMESMFSKQAAPFDYNRLVPDDPGRFGENVGAGLAGAALGGTFLPRMMPVGRGVRRESDALQHAIRDVGAAREAGAGRGRLRAAERLVADEARQLGVSVRDPRHIRSMADAERLSTQAGKSWVSKVRGRRFPAALALGGLAGVLGMDAISPTRQLKRDVVRSQMRRPENIPAQPAPVYNVHPPSMLDTMTTPFF